MERKLPRTESRVVSQRERAGWRSLRIYRRWSESKTKKKKKKERKKKKRGRRAKESLWWRGWTPPWALSRSRRRVTPFFSRLLASWLIWAVWYLTELTQAVLLALWRAARVVYVQAVQILFPDKLARRSLRNSRRKVLTALRLPPLLPPLVSTPPFPPPFLSVLQTIL